MNFFSRKEPKKTDLSELPEFPELPKLPELPDNSSKLFSMSPSAMPKESNFELSNIPESLQNKPARIEIKEPVFIKLDKFKDAVKKFEEIKEKVEEIENSLKKIREIKDREENELKSWESEVQMIKEKVASIDVSLFSKI